MDPAIRTLLARYPPQLQPSGPIRNLGTAGGLSGARLWRFQTSCGPYVLKAWPPDGPRGDHVRQIHRWLLETRSLGFVPIPERDTHGQTLQEFAGRCWELMPWMPGQADRGQPPKVERLRAAVSALATFQQRLARLGIQGHSPGLEARGHELRQLLEGEFAAFAAILDRAEPTPECEAARRWFVLARRVAPAILERLRRVSARSVRLQPCVRDARPDHFLFVGDRLTGLIDLGAMGIESVAADLGRLLSEWVGPDRLARAEALAAYEQVRPLSRDELELIPVFEQSGALLGGAHWLRWHYVQHRVFEPASAVCEGLARSSERLERMWALRER